MVDWAARWNRFTFSKVLCLCFDNELKYFYLIGFVQWSSSYEFVECFSTVVELIMRTTCYYSLHKGKRKPFWVMCGLGEDLHLAFLCKNISVEGPVGHAFESSGLSFLFFFLLSCIIKLWLDGFCQISSFLLYYLL